MAIGPRLDLRQTQTLVMTPQLQQAIKLLQLSNVEVADYVEREVEQNPLLERDDDGANSGGEDGASEAEARRSESEAAEAQTDRGEGAGEPALLDPIDPTDRTNTATEVPLDTDFENLWTGEPAGGDGRGDGGDSGGAFSRERGGRSDFESSEFSLEHTLAREATLRDHLTEQLGVDLTDPVDRIIGQHLIDLVDEAGYLTGEIAQVASLLDCPVERVAATLEQLQRFDPSGVCARSLKECLALQLRDRNRLDPAMATLLDHLDLLAKRDLPRLMRLCGVDADDLAEMVAEIKMLNPKPGLVFDLSPVQPVVPDVLMRMAPDGSWIVELNQDTLPKVLINHQYYAQVSRGARSKEEKEFISERFNSANWLVKSLHQRANTILKVATEIVRQQDSFFRQGVRYLRPLVLRDIAGAISVHESTVSRVTTNKYLAAPQGIYELKYFFTSAIGSAGGGDSHSAESVRHRIKTLIDEETAAEVLSDDRIVEILRGEGVDIARRTVAKYREALRIPSSVQRRRDKALGF
jgi:RNA polymerase sigma-54 factor